MAKSVEHIIPESLGNSTLVLERGLVCDRCNNYFARKVEKPLLDSPILRMLRFSNRIPNKRDRLPDVEAVLEDGHRASVTMQSAHQGIPSVRLLDPVDDRSIRQLLAKRQLLLSFNATTPPSDPVVSRFMAKVAIECLAHELSADRMMLASFIDDTQLDALRGHARLGVPAEWSFSMRRIYDTDRHFTNASGTLEQTVWEYCFFMTENSEAFFTLAIWGLEFVLNIGDSDVSGYADWLQKNGDASPLYLGRDPSLGP